MLKQVWLLLSISFCHQAMAQNLVNGFRDTVEIVSVRVKVTPKVYTEDFIGATDTKKIKAIPHSANADAPDRARKQTLELGRSLPKTSFSPNPKKAAVSKVKKQAPMDIIQHYPAPSKPSSSSETATARKNSFYLFSLLFLVSGTVLSLFFRAGTSLILAILLIILGYYLLLYSLLFMK